VSGAQAAVLIAFGVLAALAVGSFTCVVIDRMPLALAEPNEFGDLYDTRPWREVVGGQSRCSSCGAPIRAVDKIPVVSWFLLRGRCSGCEERIPGFHPFVELAVPVVAVLVAWGTGWDWRLLPALWLVPVAVAISVIDMRTFIVPTRIVWPAFAVSIALSVVAALVAHEPNWLLNGLVGLAVLAGPLFVIWFVMPSGMGFGDVRLTVLLGWTVGFVIGAERLSGTVLVTVLTLTIAAVVGLVFGVLVLGVRGRHARVPFGPALAAAALIVIALAEPIRSAFDL